MEFNVLSRPRINAKLSEALSYPLAKIVAGAGYGKTRAAESFLSEIAARVFWVSLTELDNLPGHLWEKIVLAAAQSDDALAVDLVKLGFPDTEVGFEKVVAAISARMLPDTQTVLLFDDYHLIEQPLVHSFVERLAVERIPRLSLMLLSRTEPDISRTNLTLKDVLYSVTQEDLAFTPNEIADYFSEQGLSIPAQSIDELHRYTAGWVVSIYLLCLSLKQGAELRSDALQIVKTDLFNLIEKEIFDLYDEQTQSGLVKISGLSSFQPGLVAEITGISGFLEKISGGNTFIRHERFSDSYWIHHLFLEFLKDKFELLPQKQRNAVHKRAAKWYARNNSVVEAAHHYRQCCEYDLMLDIIESSPDNVSTRQKCLWAISCVENTPKNTLDKRIVTQVAYGGLLFMAGRLDDCEAQLNKIFSMLERKAVKLPVIHKAILGEAYMLKGIHSYFTMSGDVLDSWAKAAELIPKGSRLLNRKIPFTLGNLSMFLFFNNERGEVERVAKMLREAAPHTIRVLGGAGAGFDLLFAAEAAYSKASFQDATQYARRSIAAAKPYEQHTIELVAEFVMLKTFVACGEVAKASELLREAKARVGNRNDMLLSTMLVIIESWYGLITGKLDLIAKWIAAGDFSNNSLLGIGSWFEQFLYARYLLYTGRLFELEAFMPVLDRLCLERNDAIDNRIEYHLLASLLQHGLGDPQKSASELQKAVELSSGNDIIMPYISYGRHMKDLLDSLKSAGCFEDGGIDLDWAANISAAAERYEKLTACNSKPGSAKKLSLAPKELEVLECLCQGLPNKKIAEQLGMTPATTKWYINQILGKLYVKNRTEAAIEAVRLGIVRK